MSYDPDIHNRRSIRLDHYDYSQEGYYFITLCVQDRACLFGEISEDKMALNPAGKMIHKNWNELPKRFLNLKMDECVVMPNHLHGIVKLNQIKPVQYLDQLKPSGTLEHSIGRIFQAFKSITTHEYIQGVKQKNWPSFSGKLWQRNYWEHVITNEYELYFIREYISHNPEKWPSDGLFSESKLQSHHGRIQDSPLPLSY